MLSTPTVFISRGGLIEEAVTFGWRPFVVLAEEVADLSDAWVFAGGDSPERDPVDCAAVELRELRCPA